MREPLTGVPPITTQPLASAQDVARTPGSLRATLMPLALALLLGLMLRLALWGNLPRLGPISDEGEYLAAATWLAQGRGFSWYLGYLWTRAPLYPLFVATQLRLFASVEVVFLSQTLLSLLNVVLVYALARELTDFRRTQIAERILAPPAARRVAAVAAILMALYLPFAVYAQVLLSETLFLSLLLGAFLALTAWQRLLATAPIASPGSRLLLIRSWSGLGLLALGGLLLGLCTLTRSLALTFVPLVVLWVSWIVWHLQGSLVRALGSAVVLGAFALAPVLPWSVYNSLRLYDGLIVVDTTGAYNLLVGAQTAYDGGRKDAAARDKVLALLADVEPDERRKRLVAARTCLLQPDTPAPALLDKPRLSQADRQQLMIAEGLCLLGEKPMAFVAKSAAELIDLFQINYGGDERFSGGFAVGRLPAWYVLALFLLDDTLYILTLPLAVVGWWLARGLPGRGLVGLWWLYNIAAAPLLFAINRFRLPLLPFAFIFAALALIWLLQPKPERAEARSPWGSRLVPLLLASILALIAATPYAYFEPRRPDQDSRWASYFGPYPSSLASTLLALQKRETYLRGEELRAALNVGDSARAQSILDQGNLLPRVERAGRVTLLASQGHYAAALALLPEPQVISDTRDVEASVLRGDVLRSLGQERPAKDLLTPEFVDAANPVQWSWDWLQPTTTTRIDFGGNLDLGYILGCYLGEGDRSVDPPSTFRWCTDGAQLRFPGAGSGGPQTLTLRVDGRGWPSDLLPVAPVRVYLGQQLAGTFAIDPTGVRDLSLELPASAPGADLVLTLRGATFVPDASDYLTQQGRVVGQLRQLAVRLDWAEIR